MSVLEGVRVIEISHERCCFAGKLMGDMGADVIVVEPPGGSPMRSYEPFVDDVPDVRGVQERRALEPEVDKCGLHARQHARDPPLIYVSDDPAAAFALHEDLLQHAVFDQRDARLTGRDVDQ